MSKEHFQKYKAAVHHNGGKSVLKQQKEEVTFDPENPEHIAAADLLFTPEPSIDAASEKEKEALKIKRAELVKRRQAVPFRFKIETPYMDIRSMVLGKTMQWAIKVHQQKRVRSATILPLVQYPPQAKARKNHG